MAAARKRWKTTPLPATRKDLALQRTYDATEFARIKAGLIPEEMEDRWFMFFEEPWFYVHRSWTGFCIYAVRFELLGDLSARIAEVQVNRDSRQHLSADDAGDALMLAALLDERAGRGTQATWKQFEDHTSRMQGPRWWQFWRR